MACRKILLNPLAAVLGFHGSYFDKKPAAHSAGWRSSFNRFIEVVGVCLLLSTTSVAADEGNPQSEPFEQVLVTLTSAQTQTQGMAMVLANAMQAQGAEVQLLLCDEAGDLAVVDAPGELLKPRDVSPQMMLKNLMQGGAQVEVCALYLPNAGISEKALIEGVSPAQPGAIAERLLAKDVRVLNF